MLEGRSVSELAATIAYHLAERFDRVPSVSTIWRILRREGLVCPQPQKRPRSSLIRFEAELPNEMWQADITHWPITGSGHAEILNMLDDHSRLFLASRAFATVKAADVVDVFRMAIALHGAPASLLCDNGAVFTATPRGGKVLLQAELERLGIVAKNSRPYHPQTCGKVERLHQTLKRYLGNQSPVGTLAELQARLDTFAHYYNTTRPHRALGGRTPAGLQRPHQGPAGLNRAARDPLPHSPRQGRQPGHRHPAPPQQAPPHRHRPGPQGAADQAACRRPRHPRAGPEDRRADPPAHPRSKPRLPADWGKLRCLRCPATSVSDVAGHHNIGETGFEPATARPPAECATRLRHSPWLLRILTDSGKLPGRR